jgi:hypothetical protein
MLAWEFIDSLSTLDVASIVALQAFFFLLLYLLVRSRQWGFLDPFTLTLFFAASSWSTVIFLYATGKCSTRLFVSFLLTNIVFMAAYWIVSPKYRKTNAPSLRSLSSGGLGKLNLLGAALCSIYFSCMLANIAIFGFGIEHETRLDIYTTSQGLGFLKRGLDSLMPAVIFLIVKTRDTSLLVRLGAYLFMGISFTNNILDGSKSGIVQVAFACFVSYAWLRRWGYLKSAAPVSWIKLGALIGGAVVMAGLVLAYQLEAAADLDALKVVGSILSFRLLIAGDVFLLGYPNEVIDKISLAYHPLTILLYDPLSTLRLIKVDVVPLGNQLYNYFLTDRVLEAGGPNSHLSIYTYYLFGDIGAPILAGLFGVLYGLIRRGVWIAKGRRLVAGALYVALLCNGSSILIDPSYSIHRMTNIAVFLVPFVFACSLTLKPVHENRGRHIELV